MDPADDRLLETLESSTNWAGLWLIASVLILIHVRRDCRMLGESWGRYVLLVWLFWPIFYPLWLLVWPGSLRLWLQDKSVADMPAAWARRRRPHDRSDAVSTRP